MRMLAYNKPAMDFNQSKKIYFSLRIACAMCFIGHGAFGFITKEIWTNYFGVFGISHDDSYTLMPYVGAMDIACGIIILFYPLRIFIGWLVVWGFLTALLRPLSGEPIAEFIERAGNFGAPLALLILTMNKENAVYWFRPVKLKSISDEKTIVILKLCLRGIVFLLIAGHGILNLIEKKAILDQYKSIGFSNPVAVAHIVGSFEVLAAFSVLIKPLRPVLLFLFLWKAASELFYPQWELFEWIERGGSYGTILALLFASDELKFTYAFNPRTKLKKYDHIISR